MNSLTSVPQHDQELVNDKGPVVYTRMVLPVEISSTGETVQAVCYVTNPVVALDVSVSLEDRADVILKSAGKRGPNIDYLVNIAKCLAEEGIVDRHIESLHQVAMQMQPHYLDQSYALAATPRRRSSKL